MQTIIIFLIALFPLCMFFYNFYRIRKAKKIVIDYFGERKIEILQIKFKASFRSAIAVLCTNAQLLFYAHLLVADGQKKKAYIKVGHELWGLLKPAVQAFQIDDQGEVVFPKEKLWRSS